MRPDTKSASGGCLLCLPAVRDKSLLLFEPFLVQFEKLVDFYSLHFNTLTAPLTAAASPSRLDLKRLFDGGFSFEKRPRTNLVAFRPGNRDIAKGRAS